MPPVKLAIPRSLYVLEILKFRSWRGRQLREPRGVTLRRELRGEEQRPVEARAEALRQQVVCLARRC